MNRSGDLQITCEQILLEVPRGKDEREALRVTHTTATTDRGEVSWYGLRIWYRDEKGELRPSKTGITIRQREIEPVLRALVDHWRANRSGTAPSSPTTTTRTAPQSPPPRVPGAKLPSTQPAEDDSYTPADDEGIF